MVAAKPYDWESSGDFPAEEYIKELFDKLILCTDCRINNSKLAMEVYNG